MLILSGFRAAATALAEKIDAAVQAILTVLNGGIDASHLAPGAAFVVAQFERGRSISVLRGGAPFFPPCPRAARVVGFMVEGTTVEWTPPAVTLRAWEPPYGAGRALYNAFGGFVTYSGATPQRFTGVFRLEADVAEGAYFELDGLPAGVVVTRAALVLSIPHEA